MLPARLPPVVSLRVRAGVAAARCASATSTIRRSAGVHAHAHSRRCLTTEAASASVAATSHDATISPVPPPLTPHTTRPRGIGGGAGAGSSLPTARPPYPFQSAAEYSSFLDRLESQVGHRFRSAELVLGLAFTCSLHRYLDFLGSGLLRFYASHQLYREFAHYDEGYLTRLKDVMHHGLNIQDIMLSPSIGVDLTEAIQVLDQAQQRWNERKEAEQAAATTDGQEGGEKSQDRTTMAWANELPLDAPTTTEVTPPSFLSSTAARAKLDRLLEQAAASASSSPSSSSSSSSSFVPHLAFPSDLLQPLLAALYLDGGWQVAERFAERVIKPQLLQLQQLLAHELPDEDLATQNYKSALQPLVQRIYGVTPTFEVVRCDGHTRFTIRVVIPPIAISPRDHAFRHPTVAVPHALSQMHATIHRPRADQIVFPEFTGTKKVATQRAARAALERIREELRKGAGVAAPPGADVISGGDRPPTAATAAAAAAANGSKSTGKSKIAQEDPTAAAATAAAAMVDEVSASSIALSPLDPSLLRSRLHSISSQLLGDPSSASASASSSSVSVSPETRASLQAQMVQLVRVLLSPDGRAYTVDLSSIRHLHLAGADGGGGVGSGGGGIGGGGGSIGHSSSSLPSASAVVDGLDILHADPFDMMMAELEKFENNSHSTGTSSSATSDVKSNELEFGQPREDPSRTSAASSSSSSSSSSSPSSSMFQSSDYHTLLSVLHALELWSLFPHVWLLVAEVHLILTRRSADLLIDGFAHGRTLPLVVQCYRRIRQQGRWRPSQAFMLRLLLSCARANPLWGWQQAEKMLAEMGDGKKDQQQQQQQQLLSPFKPSLSVPSAHPPPSLSHYAAGLLCCLRGYTTLLASAIEDPDSAALVSPVVILKTADRIRTRAAEMRGRMAATGPTEKDSEPLATYPSASSLSSSSSLIDSDAAEAVSADELVVFCICAQLDAYGNRLEFAWRYVAEIERRLGREPSRERNEYEAGARARAAAREEEESGGQPTGDMSNLALPRRTRSGRYNPSSSSSAFSLWSVPPYQYDRKQMLEFAANAQPLIETVARLMHQLPKTNGASAPSEAIQKALWEQPINPTTTAVASG